MREHSELISLFGRAEVERASARRDELRSWVAADVNRRLAVIRAMQGLQEAISLHPHKAVRFCQKLDPNVRGIILLDFMDLD